METKYYIDAQGNYIGGFAGDEPPEGAIEVPTPPENALTQVYKNGEWVDVSEALETKYYIDAQGNYIGGFAGTEPPEGAIEIDTKPKNALTQVYKNGEWVDVSEALETKYYIDAQGNYIGGFAGTEPPEGAIEVPNPPNNALTQVYKNGAWVDKPKSPEQLIAEAKAQKAEALANITVTTRSGKVFDGDEKSQARMMASLTAANTLSQTETTWILADTTGSMTVEERKALITIDELKEAQALSIVALGKILGAID